MDRKVGTVSRGIRCPIIRQGDDLAAIVVDSVMDACKSEGFELRDRDVISVTESVVARSQGNYATVNDIAADIKAKFGDETVGVIFPILSRNRFAICLKGIAMGAKKIVLMPLMVGAGDHASNDMAGDEEDSWKVILTGAGFEVECVLEGLGQNADIRAIYIDHIKAAIAEAGL